MKLQDENGSHEESINEMVEFHNSFIPPAKLEAILLSKLHNKGLLKQKHKMKSERLFWMAATVTGILIGFFGSSIWPTDTASRLPESENHYLLLLYEDSTFSATESEIPRLIREYRTWAGDLAKKGKLIAAEKLTNESIPLGNIPSTTSMASGYFVIEAASLKNAIEIAKTNPHLTYNGGIEVRPIDNLKK